MRSLVCIALAGLALAGAGCDSFKLAGGSEQFLGPNSYASAVNVFNCSEDYAIKLFTKKDGYDWVPAGNTGAMWPGGQCPEDAPIVQADLGTGLHTLKIIYWNFSISCNTNDPYDIGCPSQAAFFVGDNSAPVRDITFNAL